MLPCDKRRSPLRRRAFTLVELLTSIGILALLVSLLLVAVQMIRERARLLQCQDRIRQLALTAIDYEATHQAYPFGPLPGNGLAMFDADYPHNLLSKLGVHPLPSPAQPRRVPMILCPADPVSERDVNNLSYYINSGTMLHGARPQNGIASFDQPIRSRDVADGLSNTAMLSERLSFGELEIFWPPEQVQQDPRRFPWYTPQYYQDAATAAQACRQARTTQWPVRNIFGTQLVSSGAALGYTHRLGPNQPPCINQPTKPPMEPIADYGSLITATSLHRSGVNVTYCDGSVRLVSNSIDERVWIPERPIAVPALLMASDRGGLQFGAGVEDDPHELCRAVLCLRGQPEIGPGEVPREPR